MRGGIRDSGAERNAAHFIEQLENRRLLSATLSILAGFRSSANFNQSGLALDGAGDVFGTTATAVFEIPAGTQKMRTVASISKAFSNPAIACDLDGNLYFTGDGGILELSAGTKRLSKLSTLANAGPLITDPEGNLFGVMGGYGNKPFDLFEMSANTHQLSILTTIGDSSGTYIRVLRMDAAGNLYWLLASTQDSEIGAIWEFSAQTHDMTLVYRFDSLSYLPFNGFITDASGNIYGGNDGVFEVPAGTHALIPLSDIAATGALAVDSDGNLFGATPAAFGFGAVFEIAANTHTLSEPFVFHGYDGSFPDQLYADATGNLYGISGNTDPDGFNPPPNPAIDGGSIFEISGAGFVPASNSTPAIIAQPTSDSDIVAGSASFSANAGGYPAPTVQWQMSIDSGQTFRDINWIAGANATTLTLTDLTVSQSGTLYRAVFTNSLGSVATSAAALTVLPPLSLKLAASIRSSVVNGKAVSIGALATDPSGIRKLTYTWSVLHAPAGSAPVTFADNGTTPPKKTHATFHKSGRYTLRCTISDGGVRQIVTDTTVTVKQTATRVRVTPASSAVFRLGVKQLTATVYDQFNKPMRIQPPIDFSIASGEGTIDSSGLFTATTLPGLVDIEARAGQLAGVAAVNVE